MQKLKYSENCKIEISILVKYIMLKRALSQSILHVKCDLNLNRLSLVMIGLSDVEHCLKWYVLNSA